MALDELKDNDEVYDIDGFRYIVNKDFLEQVTPIKIDFTPLGFKIHSNMDFSAGIGAGAGCKGCETASSGCS